jgi:hypothetical protein
MGASAVVETEKAANRGAGLLNACVGAQIDLLVFDGAPKVLNKDVVAPSPLAIHADFDLTCRQHFDEVGRGEPAALDVLKISGVP